MGDNLQTNKDTNKDVFSNVNTNVNKMTLNKNSSNSLKVTDDIKKLNKTSSFVSETSSKSVKSTKSTKSSKSTKSEKSKDKSKKRSKVKNMLRLFEKRIGHSSKKEKNDDVSFSLSDTEIEDTQILNENVTEKDINSNKEYTLGSVEKVVVEEVKESNNEEKEKVNENINKDNDLLKEEKIESNENQENKDTILEKNEKEMKENKEDIEKETVEINENKEDIEKETVEINENKEEEEESIKINENKEEEKESIEINENKEEEKESIEINENKKEEKEVIKINENKEEEKEVIKINENKEEETIEINENKKEEKETIEVSETIESVKVQNDKEVENSNVIEEKEKEGTNEDSNEGINEEKTDIKEANVTEKSDSIDKEIKKSDEIEVVENDKDKEQDIDLGCEDRHLNEIVQEDNLYNKDSIISQLSQVIDSDCESQSDSISDQNTDIAKELFEKEKNKTATSNNPEMLQALIKEKENEYKAFVDDKSDSAKQNETNSKVQVIEEIEITKDNTEFKENNSNDKSENSESLKADISDLNGDNEIATSNEKINSDNTNNNGQPIQAEIINLIEDNNDQVEVKENQIKESSSDEGCINELNGFTNALKSINEINNAEKQFLIANSESMEKMINKSLQKHDNKKDSLHLSTQTFTSNSARNSLEINSLLSNKRNSFRNSYQSHQSHNSISSISNLHLQITPPQPPPDAPLPPTPHNTLPPHNVLNETSKDGNHQNDTLMNSNSYIQHYSLGRLTEFNHDTEEDNLNSSISINNRILTDSIIQENNIDSSNPTINKNKKVLTSTEQEQKQDQKQKQEETNVLAKEESKETKEVSEIKKSEVSEQSEPEKEEKNENKEIEGAKEEKAKMPMENDDNTPKETSINNKSEASKTSSKRLKDTFSNIENLLEDLDSHIQNYKTPKLRPSENDGYEGDDEIKFNMIKNANGNINPKQYIPGQLQLPLPPHGSLVRKSSLNNPYYVNNSSSEYGKPNFSNHRSNSISSEQNTRPYIYNDQKRPVSTYANPRKQYYTDSLMNEENDILPLPAVVEGPMSPEYVNDITIQRNPKGYDFDKTLYSNILAEDDDDIDIDQSLNNNLKILRNSKPSSSGIIGMGNRMNVPGSPAISTKALKLVGVEKQSIPNMSAKALKMLGMNGPPENEFANFQFDEKELEMLNAAPLTNPHVGTKLNNNKNNNNGHNRQSSNSSQNRMMMNMNMSNSPSTKFVEEQFNNSILFNEEDHDLNLNLDEDDLMGNPNMLTMGSIHSNNSYGSAGNSSFSMSQKALKVFGISESDLMSSNASVSGNANRKGMASPMSPFNRSIGIGSPLSPKHQTISLPNIMSPRTQSVGLPSSMDNLNLSRYSINDGENQVNGIISSKALKIIGLSDPPSNTINMDQNSNRTAEIFDRKALENKKEKVKEWEEVDELIRVVMPTLSSLKPILTDHLYFTTHGILKGWKKRFIVLTQDNWIYYFTNNDPKGHARASIPINSETTIRELFDPISVVPYFMEITSNWPVDSKNRRYIIIGCDNKQKCQSWVTTIKSIIARDKFSNAKLPPKPGMEDDKNSTTSQSNTGDLGSLYDEITGYSSSSNNNNITSTKAIPSHRANNSYGGSSNYSDLSINSPLLSPKISAQPNDYHINSIKMSAKNVRVTKHPVRKESFRPRYSSMLPSPNMTSINGKRTSRINSPSTIPMVSSSPLMKGQTSPYTTFSGSGAISPNIKGLNSFSLTSPSIKPIPSSVSPASPLNYRRSPLLPGIEGLGRIPNISHSPILSPKVKSIGSPYIQAQNQIPNFSLNQNGMRSLEGEIDDDNDINENLDLSFESSNLNKNLSLSSMNLGMTMNVNMELLQQHEMQEQLIRQQQQQILLLQQQLLKNQKEMEKGIMDKNFY